MGLFSKLFRGSLVSAAKAGDVAKVRELLDNGSQPNELEQGFSALMYACEKGNLEIVQLLVDRGADVNAREPAFHFTPLMAAASGKGFSDEAQKESRGLAIVELLVQHGANVNAAGKNGQTAIKFATESGHQQIVTFLENHGGTVS
jgi:ankyrin repeat protein